MGRSEMKERKDSRKKSRNCTEGRILESKDNRKVTGRKGELSREG